MPGRFFTTAEHDQRIAAVRSRMAKAGLDLLVVCDPANIDWLTGYRGWSFYTPQAVLLHQAQDGPLWVGREMDAPAARLTTDLPAAAVIPYPDGYVQSPDRHPADFLAETIRSRGWQAGRIGLEMDGYYFSPRACDILRTALPDARFADSDQLVNWARIVKSPAELSLMRQAALITERVVEAAIAGIAPGIRQCDLVADIYHAQMTGTADFGGDFTAICPLLPTGRGTGTPHLTWTDDPFASGEATIMELAAARRHYHCPMARTVHLGPPPQRLADTAQVVAEGLNAALEAARPGATCAEVEAAWAAVIRRHGLVKESRIGYAVGLNYPPDWGEHTASLRPGDHTVLQENMCFHCIPGIWGDGWGVEISETFVVTAAGGERLCNVSQELVVKS
ncbi:M24 family metallopeptidase [Marinibaculum pumilum]|uniref:M24 family metallopeptidase n=1 Tax=Marinibaculum pumilum TaxID=1766165 RepID=A0ABV7L055_9PROT